MRRPASSLTLSKAAALVCSTCSTAWTSAGGLLSGPLLFHQLLAELGGHLTADVPDGTPAALAFALDLIAGVPFPWFWHGLHLRFASHGEIYFSTPFYFSPGVVDISL